jgi:ATP-dependent Clp protease ATP-binding subunit ClpB
MATRTDKYVVLDSDYRSPFVKAFERDIREVVVGQDEAVELVTNVYERNLAGICDSSKPIASLLFLGPTGVGKTRMAEAISEHMLGSKEKMLKVNCGEYQYGHEINKLIGSPPGYLGHNETPPYFTQDKLDTMSKAGQKVSVVLFDEIEKANEALYNLLLAILDKGHFVTGQNVTLDFTHSIIVMTSNLGAKDITGLVTGNKGIGFNETTPTPAPKMGEKLDKIGIDKAQRRFSPEFYNRLDAITTFKPLSKEHIEKITDIELGNINKRFDTKKNLTGVTVNHTPALVSYLAEKGYDPKYGARPLKRAIEKEVVQPLAKVLASGQVLLFDTVRLDYKKGRVEISKLENDKPIVRPASALALGKSVN